MSDSNFIEVVKYPPTHRGDVALSAWAEKVFAESVITADRAAEYGNCVTQQVISKMEIFDMDVADDLVEPLFWRFGELVRSHAMTVEFQKASFDAIEDFEMEQVR